MLNREKTGLLIFDDFRIDHSLPKYVAAREKTKAIIQKRRQQIDAADLALSTPAEFEVLIEGFDGSEPMNIVPSIASGGRMRGDGDWIDNNLDQQKEIWKRLFQRIGMFLFGWMIPPRKPKITIQQFFKLVKADLKSPETYIEKVEEFLKVAGHAKSMGQGALYEEIIKDVHVIKQEALLLASDFKTCITEEQIVQFYKDSYRGLRLHFIQNFGRVIPLEVCKIKTEADKLMVFDNYVILYYDKTAKTFKETEAEKQRRKDPIIFGVISGVRKLYYVADWVDEYCDLTLKQLIDKFGEDAIKANNITVKYHKKT